MRFVTTRELRNTPSVLEKALLDGDVALTARGKPMGIIVPVHDDDFDDVMRAIRRARAALAVDKIRDRVADEVDVTAEIAAVRRLRRARS